VLRRYSQYNETTFTQFIRSDAARRGVPRALAPMDGKVLDLRLSTGGKHNTALQFDGRALFDAAEGGLIGTAALRGGYAGAEFEVLGTGRAPTPGFSGVSVYADTLNNLNAGRLTLGALPEVIYNTTGNIIKFVGTSSNITLREGAILSAPEVVLRTTSTTGGITVEAGAGINTLGRGNVAFDSTSGYLYQPQASSLLVVSNGWTHVLAPAAASGISGAGSIRIGACVTSSCNDPALLYSNGSITAATDNQFELGEAVRFGTRRLALAVGSVNAGSATALAAAGSRVPAGLTLNQNVLDRLLRGDTQ